MRTHLWPVSAARYVIIDVLPDDVGPCSSTGQVCISTARHRSSSRACTDAVRMKRGGWPFTDLDRSTGGSSPFCSQYRFTCTKSSCVARPPGLRSVKSVSTFCPSKTTSRISLRMVACERSFSIVRKDMQRPSNSAFTPDSFMLSAPHTKSSVRQSVRRE